MGTIGNGALGDENHCSACEVHPEIVCIETHEPN